MQEKKLVKNSRIKKITIIGVIPSFAFQRAKYCALELHKKLPLKFPLPEITGLLELDWNEKLQEWRQVLGREYWCLRRPVAVFFDSKFIGSDIELIKLATIGNVLMENIPRENTPFIKDNFRKDYVAHLRKTKRVYCYLDICVDDVYIGTLNFQLYSDLIPRACENFKTLCLGTRGPLLTYRGTRIHRIVKQGWLQGGDVQYKTGGGGFSIFCDPLEDECFGISHDRRGVLSMANAGRHQNGSQFFITLKPSKWMDTHYVAFGQLVEGVKVLRILENLETQYECPLKKVEIKSCGKLDLGDVEDVDAMYKEEPMPAKKPKRIETICDQVVRLIMEAVTDALARKERSPDVLDDGDVPSKMNIQLYFQGFYSLPEAILEKTAAYLRKLRRELLRRAKPSATEIVEVIMYDLQMAVLTRMTTLDEVRETITKDQYTKMISKIDMTMEMCKKSYVKRFVDQIISTAVSMVELVTKKIQNMKRTSKNLKIFQDRMQEWVRSFVLQETFKDTNYLIAERPYHPPKVQEEKKEPPKREGKPCCDIEKKKREEELKAKLKAKFGPEDLCCLGSKLRLLTESQVNLYDYFSTCRYGLKRVPKTERERIPLLDLIEMGRWKLRCMRKQENNVKTKERLCTEKKIGKWLAEVTYTPETSWLKDAVFPKDCNVLDHVEEIMYGAMTAGLLEMYYFMEEYLKLCGNKKSKLVTKIIYPEDSDTQLEKEENVKSTTGMSDLEFPGEQDSKISKISKISEIDEEKKEMTLQPCTCGHPCCVCPFDPKYKSAPTPPPSLEDENEEIEEEDEEIEEEELTSPPVKPTSAIEPCGSSETLVDLNAILTEKLSMKAEEIDIRSFKWLKTYILEEGCDLKTQFATQVHKWLEGESFDCRGFISKQSLVTRASLLSLSFSLMELLKEENNLKKEIKNFIFDLWELYFEEMFKEALLEFPPEEEEEEKEEEKEPSEDKEKDFDDECKEILKTTPIDYDFDTLCKKDQSKEPKDEQLPEELKEECLEEEEEEKTETEMKDSEAPSSPPPSPALPPPPPTPAKEATSEETSETSLQSAPQNETHQTDNAEMKPEPAESVHEQEKPVKKRKSPIVVEELVEESSGDESRDMPPYVLPFWIKFLTELTKQALGSLAKVSRLPKRLYFHTESDLAFDERMKEWFEFNAFNPQPTKGREIMDYISLHHKSLENLEDTARSYLKKKKYTELMNRCTRFSSADDMAEEILTDLTDTAMEKKEYSETFELFVSNVLSAAFASSPTESAKSMIDEEEEYKTFYTDMRESNEMSEENED